jgi:hypothetical protein
VFDHHGHITAKVGPKKRVFHKVDCFVSSKVSSKASSMELKNQKLTKGRLWEAQAGTLEKESLKKY